MGYWRYHCSKCGKYYGGGIPTDAFTRDRTCPHCGGSHISIREQISILFWEFEWVSKKKFAECYKQP